jgi:hypothetical protein
VPKPSPAFVLHRGGNQFRRAGGSLINQNGERAANKPARFHRRSAKSSAFRNWRFSGARHQIRHCDFPREKSSGELQTHFAVAAALSRKIQNHRGRVFESLQSLFDFIFERFDEPLNFI